MRLRILERRNAQIRSTEKSRWIAGSAIAVSCLIIGAAVLAFALEGRVRAFLDISNIKTNKDLFERLSLAPYRYLAGMIHLQSLARVSIDIKFKNWQQIQSSRRTAIEKGLLLAEDHVEVPATLRMGPHSFRATVRLKGDTPDHWANPQPLSLRVSLKGGARLFGMGAFSIQRPHVRAYFFEPLIMAFFRKIDVLSPSIRYATVELNGSDWGLMMFEQHLEPEMAESQGRQGGIFFALDEQLIWIFVTQILASRKSTHLGVLEKNPYDNMWTTPLRAINKKSVETSSKLSELGILARSLMAGFQQGRLQASQIFNLDAFAKFYAVAQIWQSDPVVILHNARFYFDPFTLKFEPVAYDSTSAPKSFAGDVAEHSLILQELFKDPKFRQILSTTLQKTTERITSGTLIADLNDQATTLAYLHSVNPLQVPDLSVLRVNAEMLSKRGTNWSRANQRTNNALNIPVNDKYRSHIVGSYFYSLPAERTFRVALGNRLPFPVRVLGLFAECTAETGTTRTKFDFQPVQLDSTQFDQMPNWRVLEPKKMELPGNCRIEVHSKMNERDAIAVDILDGPIRYFEKHPDESARNLQLPSWITWDAGTNYYLIRQGRRIVKSPIVLPFGRGLRIEGGSELLFADTAFLHVGGPVHMMGTANRPVILGAADSLKPWKGIFLDQASETSIWRNVQISNVAGFDDGNRRLTGAITVRKADIDIENVSIRNILAEDALNLVHATAKLNHLSIKDTVSDGIDLDFSTVEGKHLVLQDIGGDALDFGTSRGVIRDILIRRVKDKGMSIGEGSNIEASQIDITDAGAGVVTKDGSKAVVSNLTLTRIHVAGLMAYVKKRRFAGAQLTANRVGFHDVAHKAVAQTGSSVELDGQLVQSMFLDVDALYRSTEMQKALRAR